LSSFFYPFFFLNFVPDLKSIGNILTLALAGIALLLVFSFLHQTNDKPIFPPENKAELGRVLFFEKALSLDSSISCASCHLPAFAFSDTQAFSKGVGGKFGLRNTPSVMNVKSRGLFFYDGRAKDIFDQVHFPVEDKNEMNINFDIVVQRLQASPLYSAYFQLLYKSLPNRQNVADAIAQFEMLLESSETPFDRYMSGDETALNASEQRGRELFLSDKTKCFDCHFGPDFTGDEFKNIGLFDGKLLNDSGRYLVTKYLEDVGKFKVPGLRNVGVTGPYMHNGQFKTLNEVVAYYSNMYEFVEKPVNLDSTLIKPLNLTAQEQLDLVNFLKSLTDVQFKNR
jgi:cytochrome c peroxidase